MRAAHSTKGNDLTARPSGHRPGRGTRAEVLLDVLMDVNDEVGSGAGIPTRLK
jgi:hypothetical protein